jgi:hypothetical protein
MLDALAVFEQIREAASTMHRLPRVGVRNRFCNWPDFIRDYHAMYDPDKPDKQETAPDPFIRPSAKQIKEMDQVILWLAWLTQHPAWGAKYSKVIWAKACGVPLRAYARRIRKSERSCREWFRLGIYAILYAEDEGRIN